MRSSGGSVRGGRVPARGVRTAATPPAPAGPPPGLVTPVAPALPAGLAPPVAPGLPVAPAPDAGGGDGEGGGDGRSSASRGRGSAARAWRGSSVARRRLRTGRRKRGGRRTGRARIAGVRRERELRRWRRVGRNWRARREDLEGQRRRRIATVAADGGEDLRLVARHREPSSLRCEELTAERERSKTVRGEGDAKQASEVGPLVSHWRHRASSPGTKRPPGSRWGHAASRILVSFHLIGAQLNGMTPTGTEGIHE